MINKTINFCYSKLKDRYIALNTELKKIMIKNVETYRVLSNKTEPYNYYDLIRNFSIIKLFVWRDLKVKYRHTFLGIFWYVVQPLMMMFVITLGLGFVYPNTDLDLPYPLYVASGLVLWTHFSNGFSDGSKALDSFKGVIEKIAFQRACLPLVAVITAIVDMIASSFLLIAVMLFYHSEPSWRIIFMPILIIWGSFFIYGLALFFSAASVLYRDVRHFVPFLTQLLFFCTPVFLKSEYLSSKFGVLASVNPLVTYLNFFRWLIFSDYPSPSDVEALIFIIMCPLIFIIGYGYFQKKQILISDNL